MWFTLGREAPEVATSSKVPVPAFLPVSPYWVLNVFVNFLVARRPW